MTKRVTDLPQAHFTYDDALAGRLPALQAAMALKHGPIFRWAVNDGPRPGDYVHLVGPEANRFVLHTGREHFSHDQGWAPVIGEALGKGLLNMDGTEHTRHRKLWNPSFTAAAMEAYLPVIERLIAERTANWPLHDEVDVYNEARQITFTAAARALAGFEPGPQLAELGQLFSALAKHDRRDQMLLDLIAERRTRPADEDPHDVVGMIVRARDDDGQPLSDEQILAHINILLVAGHETTTTLSAWVLYLLATMPAQRERIEGELHVLLGDKPGPLAVEALRRMKHLDNFIKEVSRLYTPLVNVPRGVTSAFAFSGYSLPPGTQVRLALGAGHLLPHVFAEPQRFDPDRFAPPREEDRRTPYGLVAFGGGARMCIGLNFATIETKALAAYVLRHYRLQAPEDQEIVHIGALAAAPNGPVRLRVRPRYKRGAHN